MRLLILNALQESQIVNDKLEYEKAHNDSNQQSTWDKHNKITSDVISDEDKVIHEQVQNALSKSIIRPCEEIRKNKHIIIL